MPDHSQAKPRRELTGKHVLISVVLFFAVLILVNGTFIFAAVGSFRGEDVKQSYRQGLEYNSVLDDRRAQAALGWTAIVDIEDNESDVSATGAKQIIVKIKDAKGQSMSGVLIKGRLRHPIDTARDIPLTFASGVPAIAEIRLSAGRWTLEAEAQRGDDKFAFRKDVAFK